MLKRSLSPEMVSITISLVISVGRILRLTTKLRRSNLDNMSALFAIGLLSIIKVRKAWLVGAKIVLGPVKLISVGR